jgi:3-oxoacyl-[acyl-carrier-protein] synthase-3
MAAGIVGTGCYLPARTVTNADLARDGLDTTDAWIVEHTGIRERRIADADEATSDLAARAAAAAIENAGLSARDITLVICATSTPDHLMPATASIVQDRIGSGGGAFDLNAACSGFPYALSVGMALQAQQPKGRVLVIGADTYSRYLDWSDRSSAIFFGDGAGAVVLGPSAGNWLLASHCGSDGSHAGDIVIPAGGSRTPPSAHDFKAEDARFRMKGRAVWDFVRRQFPIVVRRVVADAALELGDIALVIPHQANGRLLRACAADLGIDEHRLFLNLDGYANTAAASIPIALAEAIARRRINEGDNVVLVGFGAGLAWSALCLRWGGR